MESTELVTVSETPLTELAVETYGENFHRDERFEIEEPTRQSSRESSIETKAAKAPAVEPEQPIAESVEAEPVEETDATWSTADVQLISQINQQAELLQHDLSVWAQYQAADINQLAGGDKAKAAVIRAQLAQTKEELRERYNTLQGAAMGLQSKAQQQQIKQAQRLLQKELAKVTKDRPDFDAAANRRFLEAEGFTKAEISGVTNARLAALVDDARRYRESQQAKKVPVYRKGRKPPVKQPPADPEFTDAIAKASKGNGLRENASTLLRKQPAKRQSVADLSRRLKQSGSIDDAYAILQAQKRA